MKIVVAPDSFKGSQTATQACSAIAAGLRRASDKVEIVSIPMADGGEGTVEALVESTGGKLQIATVRGPSGEKITANYGILGETTTAEPTAVIEMAAAAGLPLVPSDKRNPLKTTTYGVGQLIMDAYDQGCRDFIIGIGGSATNDCGTGMAQALGARFFDRQGKEITESMTGELMGKVGSLNFSNLPAWLSQCSFTVACDVKNPLLGPRGASFVYARQKGANDEIIEILEANMMNIIGFVEGATGKQVRDIPGSGAAGGLGAGLLAFLNAQLEPGIDIVIRYSRFAERIRSADLIITGEGQIDGTTVAGKTIAGIAALAEKYSKPLIALAGSLGDGYQKVLELPAVMAVLSICPGPITLDEAMGRSGELLGNAAEQALRLILLGSSYKNWPAK
ncbi:MAG: glycerate kinase [Sedimentisphaerales bacterium]|nr:glycerate kinase [Sedimentisphaerales bacterium]